MGALRNLKVSYLSIYQNFEKQYFNTLNISHVPLLYYNIRNWGDKLNPILVEKISEKKVWSIDIDTQKNSPLINEEKYMVIGSILHHVDKDTVVWGSGLISDNILPKVMPKKILAVRGAKTAQILKQAGFPTSDIYGDPALLLPKFFPASEVKKKKLGIVLHNDDLTFRLPKWAYQDDEVDVISLRGNEFSILDRITSCDNIVSSSLHGLIVADSYSIPSRRLVLKGKLYGGDFKFDDYYSSLGRKSDVPLRVDSSTTKLDLIKACDRKELSIDLDKLFSVCPFLPAPHS